MATNTKFQDVRAELDTDITGQWTTDALTATFHRYPPLGHHFTREDQMWLGEARFSQEPLTFGGNYEETLQIDFVVFCPSYGNSEEEWDEAVGRAEALLDSALTILRSDITINNTVFNVELGDTTNPVDQVDENGPIGVIDGTLELESHV